MEKAAGKGITDRRRRELEDARNQLVQEALGYVANEALSNIPKSFVLRLLVLQAIDPQSGNQDKAVQHLKSLATGAEPTPPGHDPLAEILGGRNS